MLVDALGGVVQQAACPICTSTPVYDMPSPPIQTVVKDVAKEAELTLLLGGTMFTSTLTIFLTGTSKSLSVNKKLVDTRSLLTAAKPGLRNSLRMSVLWFTLHVLTLLVPLPMTARPSKKNTFINHQAP
jgi:hypothetical protein